MEAVVIGAFLNTSLPKLWEVITQGHALRLEIKKDIDYIEEELPSLEAFIRKHKLLYVNPSSGVSEIIKKAHRLADDTEQCISRFLLYQTHRRRHSWKMSHAHFATKIKDFRSKLDEIKKELSNLELGSRTLSSAAAAAAEEEPRDVNFGTHPFVGMAVPVEELVELLGCVMPAQGLGTSAVTNKVGKGKLKVIFIVGIGGSGKTRLAEHVGKLIGDQFGVHRFVPMGPKKKIVEIAEALRKGLQLQLHHKQRYLIVIDDLRSADGWKALMKDLPDSDVGSRIIVTTSSQAVAEHCRSLSSYVYKMSKLCYKDSLDLLSGVVGKISPAQEDDLSTLINTCDGLPLALIESAELLPQNTVERMDCQNAIRNLCVPGEDINGVLTRMQWVLINNYSGLPSNGERACLLYFHMFPLGNLKKRKFLIRRWLAEGLIERNGAACSDLDAASNHLKSLSDRNMIRSMQVSNNPTVKSCSLPGTIHQFISLQSLWHDFITFLRFGEEPPKPKRSIRRLSLHGGAADSNMCIDGVDVSLLRTLAVSGKACETVLDFPKYELLRVLDLKEWDCDHQLTNEEELQDKIKGVWKLVMLKYLGLPGSITKVPRKIGNLQFLETLDLDVGGTETVEVYGEVIKLPKLKHLLGKFHLSTEERYEKCVPKESRLDTISGFVVSCNGKQATFPKLMKHMKQLKKVKMWCDSQVEEKDVKDLSAAIKEYIERFLPTGIERSLSIDVTDCKVQFLESLEVVDHAYLTKLRLHGSLKNGPKFITSFKGLRGLCLSLTTLCGEGRLFPSALEDDALLLSSLQYLKLVEVELGPIKILPKHFPSLVRLCLVGKKTLNGITVGALEHLTSLHIMCKALDGLAGIQIGGPGNLNEIALDSQVSQTTKDAWKDAARGHPNRPHVLFVEAAVRKP